MQVSNPDSLHYYIKKNHVFMWILFYQCNSVNFFCVKDFFQYFSSKSLHWIFFMDFKKKILLYYIPMWFKEKYISYMEIRLPFQCKSAKYTVYTITLHKINIDTLFLKIQCNNVNYSTIWGEKVAFQSLHCTLEYSIKRSRLIKVHIYVLLFFIGMISY